VISRVLLVRYHPDLVVERYRFLQHENTKPWDKVLAPLMAFGGVLISTVAGVNVRFDSSPAFTLPVQLVGLVVILAGLALGTWAMIANRFFSGVVRLQSDRGHRVVSGGPYRWVRHPGYAAALWVYLAIPFFLNSLWAMLPAGLLFVVILIRTTLEDRFLQAELEGYRAYADRVPYRLLPGIW
jgi:protein-S-isoprenylcysteine O-methyltransferase Ste14